MKLKLKQRASKNTVNTDPSTDREKLSLPDSASLYRNVCAYLKVVHGHTVQKGQQVGYHFILLSRFRLDKFLLIYVEDF